MIPRNACKHISFTNLIKGRLVTTGMLWKPFIITSNQLHNINNDKHEMYLYIPNTNVVVTTAFTTGTIHTTGAIHHFSSSFPHSKHHKSCNHPESSTVIMLLLRHQHQRQKQRRINWTGIIQSRDQCQIIIPTNGAGDSRRRAPVGAETRYQQKTGKLW